MTERRVILHIEDDTNHARLIARSLSKQPEDYVVHLVEDGQAALDYLYRRGEFQEPESSPRPDLILLDLRLPKVEGLDVLKSIKTHGELGKIPTVVLSSSEAHSDIALAYAYQANSYLVKPVDFDDFGRMMEHFGLYWLGWNRFAGVG
jgi:CheY-like chemotaxis protein